MSEKPLILVVEDDITLRETLVYNLEKQDYAVMAVGDGILAIEATREKQPDLMVLDVNIPGADGFEVCRILRKDMQLPILLLTARDDEIDRVIGLEMGADDYITKPFSMRELMARVKAHLRRERIHRETVDTRVEEAPQKNIWESRGLKIDEDRHEVTLNDRVIDLKPKEFELLCFLVKNVGRALSREYLLERVWGWDFTGNSRTVDVHISWLRDKIESEPEHPVRIVTVRGAGYRFDG